MNGKELLDELISRITPLMDTEEEIRAVPVYLETDKYREKLLAFLDMAEKKGDKYSADQLMILVLKLSKEEEADE